MLYLLSAVFVASLLIAVSASAAFTRRLETLSDRWHFSPGLLSLLGALGANIPNYVASLSAAISGEAGVGVGIIIGSNIYNLAVILCIAAVASPERHGLLLSQREGRDARLVGGLTLAMMVTAGLAAGFFSWKNSAHVPPQATLLISISLLVCNLLTLGLFGLLAYHAFQRTPEKDNQLEKSAAEPTDGTTRLASPGSRWRGARLLCEIALALGIALGGVVVMVQAGEAAALVLHLPQAVLSLIILAVATSLPNTIVAFTLARTGRAGASVEELFSSNSVNAALGIALPLLFWTGLQGDPLLVILDAPFMVALTLSALLCVVKRRVSRTIGWLLVFVYLGWIVLHLALA